jgi:hypothetical protein
MGLDRKCHSHRMDLSFLSDLIHQLGRLQLERSLKVQSHLASHPHQNQWLQLEKLQKVRHLRERLQRENHQRMGPPQFATEQKLIRPQRMVRRLDPLGSRHSRQNEKQVVDLVTRLMAAVEQEAQQLQIEQSHTLASEVHIHQHQEL